MLKLGALVQFCLLLGVKQTSLPHRKMSAFDPKRTSHEKFAPRGTLVGDGGPREEQNHN